MADKKVAMPERWELQFSTIEEYAEYKAEALVRAREVLQGHLRHEYIDPLALEAVLDRYPPIKLDSTSPMYQARLDKHTQELIDILADWFRALEAGTADFRQPMDSRPDISDEVVTRIVTDIDTGFAAHAPLDRTDGPFDTPDFYRLGAIQQRMMVEELFDRMDYQCEHLEEYFHNWGAG